MKAMHTFILLLLSFVFSAATYAQEGKNREGVEYLASETKTLELLGKAKGVDLISLPGLHTFAGLPAAEAYFRTNVALIEGRSISSALKPLTQALGAIETNVAVSMEISAPCDLAAVQKLLGASDRAARHDEEEKVDWHRYGWLEFGARNGRVLRLRARCLPAIKRVGLK